MSWRDLAVAAVVVSTPMAMLGCTDTVTGTAMHAHPNGDGGYGFGENRCGKVSDTTVRQLLGADSVVRPYSGAVCQYILARHSTAIDAVFSWFETGTLAREHAVAEQSPAQVTDLTIQRHAGFLARRSVTGNACSATVTTDPGVATWWVQFRGDVADDPCAGAQKLLAETLSSGP